MATTVDQPAPGLRVVQPSRGFRYGAEAFWLAGLALDGGPVHTALDLGTGSGIVALLLASRGVDAVGIDARPEWEPLWRETLAGSTVAGRIRLERADVSDGFEGRFDRVVANPPFFAADTGPAAADPWKRAARTETTATLRQFLAVAEGALAPGGRVVVVVPVEREPEVLAATGLVPARIVRVGRRRSLVALAREGEAATPEVRDEQDPVVRAWYLAFR